MQTIRSNVRPSSPDVLDRQLMEFEVLQVVLSLKLARVAQAGLADVDGGDARVGLAKRISGRLRRAAAGNQNLLVSAQRLGRPDQMEQRAATVRVPVQVAVLVQVGDRRRIRHPFVEVADRSARGLICFERPVAHSA